MLDRILVLSIAMLLCFFGKGQGISLPEKFEDVTILQGLIDPSAMAFSPDGRLFICERITGGLKVAEYNAGNESWEILATAFHEFDVPALRHRSAGLRGIAFDPNFVANGYVYAYYMKDNPRHNRVVRIQQNFTSPSVSTGTELLLLELPFNNTTSSGSHNGGDLVFGPDGTLFLTTGDGWNGGDDVQSLNTYTGKLFRINTDGSIPADNPFYNQASGDLRGIYALGLRNPYTLSCPSNSGNIYINDAVGSAKATVYQIKADGSSAGANFGHDGYNGIGDLASSWVNTATGEAKLITGGAWYPVDGYWPPQYRGSYFAAMWGSNNGNAGHITRIASEMDKSLSIFASNVLLPPRHKPVMTEIGPDGNLYYLLTDYETGDGEIHMIRYTDQSVASSPEMMPIPGQYDDPIMVSVLSTTPNATIYYTLDGSDPDSSDLLYQSPIWIDNTITLRAIAYAEGFLKSAISTGQYLIGPVPNLPPIADAGPDRIIQLGNTAVLNGTGSMDPDGTSLEINESWIQVSGPPTEILDEDETVANVAPSLTGTYVYRILVEDVDGAKDSAEMRVTVVQQLSGVEGDLIARWSAEEGVGDLLEDSSPNANRGNILGPTWLNQSPDGSNTSIDFDGIDDLVSLGTLDITGDALTICFWVKLDSYNVHDARFISKADGQNDQEHKWMLSTLNGNQFRFRLNTSNDGTTTLISPANALSLNTWIHLAGVYDGQNMILYKDGIEIARTEKTGIISSDPSMSAALGNQPSDATGGSRPLDGSLDEIRIYGSALSTEEIMSIRNAAVENCSLAVQNDHNSGNGSLRRAITCTVAGDTVSIFSIPFDTIKITDWSLNLNNSIVLTGDEETIIHNVLNEAGLYIRENTVSEINGVHFWSPFGQMIVNHGTLILNNSVLKTYEDSTSQLIDNQGLIHVKGSVTIKQQE